MSPADAQQYLPRISRSSRCMVLCYAVNAAFVLCREFGQFRWPSYTFLRLAGHHSSKPLLRGEEKGSKSPFFQLSEPVSPSSLLLISSSRYIQFNSPYSQLFFFSFLRNFPPISPASQLFLGLSSLFCPPTSLLSGHFDQFSKWSHFWNISCFPKPVFCIEQL